MAPTSQTTPPSHVVLALARPRDTVGSRVLPLHLLPRQLTLTALQTVVERIMGVPLGKRAFRRRLRGTKSLVPN